MKEVREFNTWIGSLPHKYKVVIAGNHELSFDQDFRNKMASTQNDCGDFGATASADQINASTPFSPRMVYCGRGGNDAHSAFSVSRSGSSTKILGKVWCKKSVKILTKILFSKKVFNLVQTLIFFE